jgi:hypothetical protein
MSLNKNIDIKEKKLLLPQPLKDENKNIYPKENINNKLDSKLKNSEYRINISKIYSKGENINIEKNQNNEKTIKINHFKIKGAQEKSNLNKNTEKINHFSDFNTENIKAESENEKKTLNNLEKFNLGLPKNTSTSRNTRNLNLNKNFQSDQRIDNHEEQILILNTNKFENTSKSNNYLTSLDINSDINCKIKLNSNKNLNFEEIAAFKTIEIDKYNDKLKERERIKSKNNSYVNNRKGNYEKSNLKYNKSFKDKNDEEDLNKNKVNFRSKHYSKKSTKINQERNKSYVFKTIKSLLSIDIFKSKGDANIIDRRYKKENNQIKKIINNEFMSKKSGLIAAENIINHNKQHFKNLSPIRIKKKGNIETDKQTELMLFKTKKDHKGK